MQRRKFIQHTASTSLALAIGLQSCQQGKQNVMEKSIENQLKISLAQWSLHKSFFDKTLDPIDFAAITKSRFDIEGVEYVNQFYKESGNDDTFWIDMKSRADNVGVKSLLIMVDDEGELGTLNDDERHTAVENHYKWVDAAKLLGCHSIRVNAFGDGTKLEVAKALEDGLSKLSDYASKENINVLIENHGLYSSDGNWVTQIIKNVNMPNLGTLPDFGNWCTNIKWGSIHGEGCETIYDIYQGVADFLPYAKGVSAKSYNFDDAGEETAIDFGKMMTLVKAHQFQGYIGVEYEGSNLSEDDGILATKKLIEKYR